MSQPHTNHSKAPSRRSSLLKPLSLIGPMMIIGAMQFGPGSTLTGAVAGSEMGYSAIWIVAVSSIFMLVYTDMGLRIGLALPRSPMGSIGSVFGTTVRAVLGLAFFFMAVLYMTGSLAGAAIGLSILFPGGIGLWAVVSAAFTAILLWGPHAYTNVEKLMTAAVALMAVVFGVTAIIARPDVGSLMEGFVPGFVPGGSIAAISIIGTNFTVYACLYAGYAIREKQTQRKDYTTTTRFDTIPGVLAPGVIMIFVVIAAAAVTGGEPIESVDDIVAVIEPTVGVAAAYVFAFGIFAAGLSSVIGNAAVGGTIPPDGFNRGGSLSSFVTKIVGSVVLLISTVLLIVFGGAPVSLVLLVSALSVLVFPFLALMMFLVANRREMAELKNKWWQNALAIVGWILIVWAAVRLTTTLL